MCFGVSLRGTVFQNLLSYHLRRNSLPVWIASDAAAYVTELKGMPKGSAFRLSVVELYTKTYQGVMTALTSFAALGALVSIGVESSRWTWGLILGIEFSMLMPSTGKGGLELGFPFDFQGKRRLTNRDNMSSARITLSSLGSAASTQRHVPSPPGRRAGRRVNEEY